MSSIRYSRSEEETRAVGASLAPRLLPNGVLLLQGDLGSGKTILAQGLASGLGIDPREVQSPSFTLIREHEGSGGRLVHVDLYRLEPQEVEGLGLWEVLAADSGVKVVEWSERLPFEVPGAVTLEIHVESPSLRRRFTIRDEPARAQANRVSSSRRT